MTIPSERGRGMTDDELNDFLTNSRIIAKIATVDKNGWPSVNPVWYEYNEGYFYLVTKEKVSFVPNIRNDNRVALCIENWEIPYKRVIVKGVAEFIDQDWVEMGRRMTLRYLGTPGLSYFNATLHLPRIVVRIKPVKMSTWAGTGIDRTFFKAASWRALEAEG
ncbi:MAG: pyridoxamine 5'-phosphate oxidase family protein [Conexivisphaerales archaeon]